MSAAPYVISLDRDSPVPLNNAPISAIERKDSVEPIKGLNLADRVLEVVDLASADDEHFDSPCCLLPIEPIKSTNFVY